MRSGRWLVVVAAAVSFGVGCGSGGGTIEAVGGPVSLDDGPIPEVGTGTVPETDGGEAGPGRGAGIDACSLVTQDDLDALGLAVELGDGTDATEMRDELSDVPSASCEWQLSSESADGGYMGWTFSLVVERGTDSGGFEEVAQDSFMETEPESVAGLGEMATYQEDLFLDGPDKKNRIAVLAGRDVVVIDNLEEKVIPKDLLVDLCRRVLDRLGAL